MMADASDFDGFNGGSTRQIEMEKEKEKEMPLSQQQQEEHPVLDSTTPQPQEEQPEPLASSAENEQQHSAGGSELEAKKQRLLEELESALLPKGKPNKDSDKTPAHQDLPLPVPVPVPVGPSIGLGLGLGLGIEVIDETALVETLALAASGIGNGNGNGNGKGKGKKGSGNAVMKKDGNNQTSSRRRAKKQYKIGKKTTEPPSKNGNGNGKLIRYSRKEMEALRFVNVDQQRTFWNAIYTGLEPHVATEYDTLLAVALAVCLPSKKQAPPILSVGAANGRWRYMNVFVH